MNLSKIYEQIKYINHSKLDELLFVTLHYKQSSFSKSLNFNTIQDTLYKILTKLSKLYYKNAFKRYNKRVSSYAVAERSYNNRHLHNHLIIQIPKHSNIREFKKYITQSYFKSEFAYDNKHKLDKIIDITPVYDADELIKYMHKNLHNEYAEIDTKNINNFTVV